MKAFIEKSDLNEIHRLLNEGLADIGMRKKRKWWFVQEKNEDLEHGLCINIKKTSKISSIYPYFMIMSDKMGKFQLDILSLSKYYYRDKDSLLGCSLVEIQGFEQMLHKIGQSRDIYYYSDYSHSAPKVVDRLISDFQSGFPKFIENKETIDGLIKCYMDEAMDFFDGKHVNNPRTVVLLSLLFLYGTREQLRDVLSIISPASHAPYVVEFAGHVRERMAS
ncbi:MAG: hypothetical protein ACOYVG_16610, partial [Bacteroidota bacterium]